jgi:putative hydrolase of the HAD superfamily
MQIKALLIDADGVIQHMNVPWQDAFARLLGTDNPTEVHRFTTDIWAAEAAGMTHAGGFMNELSQTLKSWNLAEKLEHVVAAMQNIRTYEDNMSVVQSIRRKGIGCYLASNQEAGRARHMSERLNYKSLFDREIYSCFLGVAKPSVRFFEQALSVVGTDAVSTLFLDDKPENVEAARKAGLHAVVVKGEHGADALRAQLANFGLT